MKKLLLLGAMLASCSAFAQQPVVQTQSGVVHGTDNGAMYSYRGIPYAQPPVGELRWKPPVPVKPWTGELAAGTYSQQCPQNADLGVFSSAGGSEDCLYLNVFANKKAADAGKKLPVLV